MTLNASLAEFEIISLLLLLRVKRHATRKSYSIRNSLWFKKDGIIRGDNRAYTGLENAEILISHLLHMCEQAQELEIIDQRIVLVG